MIRFFFYCLSFISFHNCLAQSNPIPVYYTLVNMPGFLKNDHYGLFDTKLLAEDLANLLQQATGKSFKPMEFKNETGPGIFLLLDSSKRSLGNETGIMETDGKNFIRIVSGYTTGISYAMYSWLEELGFHFYLPGDDWAIIPSLSSVLNKGTNNKTYKPYFHMRMFSPSGGMPAVKGLDETRRNAKEWQQWYIRNRMGCDYLSIGGHMGESFNIKHKNEIESDPAIVAPVNGKRQFTVNSKLDPTYKKGVALFSDWIADEFVKEKKAYPGFLPFKKYFSADLGDGLGYCHTAACDAAFKTVSDQAFSIVNEAAKKVHTKDPDGGVSTLAYAERADTPSVKIEDNVHVMVVSTSFQQVGTAAELVKRWAKKSSHISVYDYLNIGVWYHDKPFFNLDRYFNNLKFLQSLHVEGLAFETSLSKFASGIQQFFILQFLCDPYTSIEDQLDLFCKNSFGPASTPVKKLFKEWYFSDVHLQTNLNYPSFYGDELGRFIQYIIEAENATGLSAQIKKRIDELKAYIIYLCKYYELYADLESISGYVKDPSSRNEKVEELLQYTWKLYFTNIFHNTQLNDILKQPLAADKKEKWNYAKSDQFKNITADVSLLIKDEFEKLKKKYLPLATAYLPITDSFLETNTKFTADSIMIATADENSVPGFLYPLDFYCAAPGLLKINYETSNSLSKQKVDKTAFVSVESADYRFLQSNIIYDENAQGSITYNLPSKGHYRLYLSQYNSTHVSYVIFPGKNLFYLNKKSLPTSSIILQAQQTNKPYPNKYLAFYAPPADSIRFKNIILDSKNMSKLYSASGISMPARKNKEQFYNTAAIIKNEQYPFIFFENSQYRWPPVLVNTSPYYFFLGYPIR